MSKKPRLGLGKGLSALLGAQMNFSNSELERQEYFKYLEIDAVEPDPNQPRQNFIDESLNELADSIKSHGIINPIIVYRLPESDKYRLIAGERRWRAAQILELATIPAIIKNLPPQERAEIALIENIQRQDLNAIEEAAAYLKLVQEYNYSQGDLAGALGKSRSHIANIMRLNNLPETVKNYVRQGLLSMGQARTLLSAPDVAALAEIAVAKKLSVRQIELLVKKQKNQVASIANPLAIEAKQDLQNIANILSEKFNINIEVKQSSKDNYQLIWHIDSLEKLDDILQQLV